jgi:membrane-associated phospholipid phosphatase
MKWRRCYWRFVCLLALGPALADPVLDWNQLMIDTIRADDSAPTLASRNLAVLHAAIYDAVNSIDRTHQPYRFLVETPTEASADAAATAAAYEVTKALYPSLAARSDQLRAAFLAQTPPTPERANGLLLGTRIGRFTLEARAADGSATQVPYIPSSAPGQWRRTPPFFRPPVDPHWRYVTLFCLSTTEPFLAPGPPPLGSAAYAQAFSEVKTLGAADRRTRSTEQSQIADFWSDFSYTATPPGHWQEIAATVARNRGNSLTQNARLFALLSLAQADAAIVCWEAKYRHNFWRPVTAIARAGEDGNADTQPDPAWSSYLNAPPFPEYPSGHSTFSAASAQVLARFFGTDAIRFSAVSDALPGMIREFSSLTECADEVGHSRVYGGIHFQFSNRDGKHSGARVGAYVSDNFLLPNHSLPQLQLEAVQKDTAYVRAHGHLGRTLVVETSDDLIHWQPISTNLAAPGGVLVMDRGGFGLPRRFYRVAEP